MVVDSPGPDGHPAHAIHGSPSCGRRSKATDSSSVPRASSPSPSRSGRREAVTTTVDRLGRHLPRPLAGRGGCPLVLHAGASRGGARVHAGQHLATRGASLRALRRSRVSFADAFPFLLLSEESLADLNRRMPTPLPMNRFRPNLVIRGGAPFAEDELGVFAIGGIDFPGGEALRSLRGHDHRPGDRRARGPSRSERWAPIDERGERCTLGKTSFIGILGCLSVGNVVRSVNGWHSPCVIATLPPAGSRYPSSNLSEVRLEPPRGANSCSVNARESRVIPACS